MLTVSSVTLYLRPSPSGSGAYQIISRISSLFITPLRDTTLKNAVFAESVDTCSQNVSSFNRLPCAYSMREKILPVNSCSTCRATGST